MLIIALVLAVIGLAALVTAVVTSNELIAWVCIAASVIGVVLLIVDALQERSRRDAGEDEAAPPPEDGQADADFDADYPDEAERAESEADTTAVAVEEGDDEVAGEDRNTR
ncbi:MAG: DUF308 domain-containing protein [Mycobacterium sp.]